MTGGRRGLVAPQNTFLENIIRRSSQQRKRYLARLQRKAIYLSSGVINCNYSDITFNKTLLFVRLFTRRGGLIDETTNVFTTEKSRGDEIVLKIWPKRLKSTLSQSLNVLIKQQIEAVMVQLATKQFNFRN